MIDLSFINDPDFRITVLFFLSVGLVSWFMGWGLSFISSLFIKITSK